MKSMSSNAKVEFSVSMRSTQNVDVVLFYFFRDVDGTMPSTKTGGTKGIRYFEYRTMEIFQSITFCEFSVDAYLV